MSAVVLTAEVALMLHSYKVSGNIKLHQGNVVKQL
jgi:hypothetical protein